MIKESIKVLSEAGYEHPFYGRTIYMTSEKQRVFFRSHIAQLRKKALNYNKVEFGPDNKNSTVDMVVPVDGQNKRIYITFYPFDYAKNLFARHIHQIIFGVFTFHIEDFTGTVK